MKYLKLYESFDDIDTQKIIDLFEDVKTIEYILEEIGLKTRYKLRFKVGGKYEDFIEVKNNLVPIITHLRKKSKYNFVGFVIEIDNLKNVGGSKYDKVYDDDDFKKNMFMYSSLLKDHLDYVDESFISIRTYKPLVTLTTEIIISKEYFMK